MAYRFEMKGKVIKVGETKRGKLRFSRLIAANIITGLGDRRVPDLCCQFLFIEQNATF